MNVEYRQESHPELMEKARARFADEIRRLRALGFSEFCCYTELMPKFSALINFPIFFLAKLNRELIRMESPLRLVMSQPILAHHSFGTYALVFGMGVKFYTLFNDETGLVTANFQSQHIQDMQRKIYKFSLEQSLENAWLAHQTEIVSFQNMGRQVNDQIRFENYVSISKREEGS